MIGKDEHKIIILGREGKVERGSKEDKKRKIGNRKENSGKVKENV